MHGRVAVDAVPGEEGPGLKCRLLYCSAYEPYLNIERIHIHIIVMYLWWLVWRSGNVVGHVKVGLLLEIVASKIADLLFEDGNK